MAVSVVAVSCRWLSLFLPVLLLLLLLLVLAVC